MAQRISGDSLDFVELAKSAVPWRERFARRESQCKCSVEFYLVMF